MGALAILMSHLLYGSCTCKSYRCGLSYAFTMGRLYDYHDNRIVGSVREKHIHMYGLVSTGDLILFIFHEIALVARSTK